jgi:hypothetical protein
MSMELGLTCVTSERVALVELSRVVNLSHNMS